MKTERLRAAGLVLGLLLITVCAASAEWKDPPPAPMPSDQPWVFDFGTGWLTAQANKQGVLLLLKKLPFDLESQLQGAGGFGIAGFDLMQVIGNKLVRVSVEPPITFKMHFRMAVKRLLLITDDLKVRAEIPLTTGAFEKDGFAGKLTDEGKGNYTLVLVKWPPGDPLMGN